MGHVDNKLIYEAYLSSLTESTVDWGLVEIGSMFMWSGDNQKYAIAQRTPAGVGGAAPTEVIAKSVDQPDKPPVRIPIADIVPDSYEPKPATPTTGEPASPTSAGESDPNAGIEAGWAQATNTATQAALGGLTPASKDWVTQGLINKSKGVAQGALQQLGKKEKKGQGIFAHRNVPTATVPTS